MELGDLKNQSLRDVKLEKEKTIMFLKKELYDILFQDNRLKPPYVYNLIQYDRIEFDYMFIKDMESYATLANLFGEDKMKEKIPKMLKDALEEIFPNDNAEVTAQSEDYKYFISISSKEG